MDHSAHAMGNGTWEHLAHGPFDVAAFALVFSFSFAASFHCAFMCGPLLGLRLAKCPGSPARHAVLYNVGRSVAYVAAGALLGGLSQSLVAALPWVGTPLALVLGTGLIVAGTFHGLGRRLPWVGSFHASPRWSAWLARTRRWPAPVTSFALGAGTVFLPCMTLTPALSAAAASGSLVKGALCMAAFALGTWPVMLGMGWVPWLVQPLAKKGWAKTGVAGLTVAMGLVTIFRIFH